MNKVDLEATRSVKRRYEKKLLRLKGVQGVGVGQRDGKPVIRVYVETDVASAGIPSVLEGVPVMIKKAAAFEAR
ncbi:hypothetical protein WB388_32525 [Streptomyces brasiliscabiei]|uniref:Uncharacterized protein n=1 Tax=Streptomyces brasiliscabiei TaxID=2736302 RepID=A0ABU8GH24_9ACTN